MEVTGAKKSFKSIAIVMLFLTSALLAMVTVVPTPVAAAHQGAVVYDINDEVSYPWVELSTDEENANIVNASDAWSGLAGMDDDDVTLNPIPIGFEFELYGNPFTQVFISSNGFISFDPIDPYDNPSLPPAGSELLIPNSNKPNNVVAPFWYNIDPSEETGEGDVYYGTFLNSELCDGNCDVFIVEWFAVDVYDKLNSFQLVLFDHHELHKIVFQYKDMQEGSIIQGAPTVGVESADSSSYTVYPYEAARELDEQSSLDIELTPQSIGSVLSLFEDDVEYVTGESSYQYWITNPDESATPDNLWHITTRSDRVHSGTHSWYYGKENRYNYYTDDGNYIPTKNSGNLTSVDIDLSHADTAALSFWHWLDAEPNGENNVPEQWYDDGYVEVLDPDTLDWVMMEHYDNTYDYIVSDTVWVLENIDLSYYAGKNIKIRFRFDTLDNSTNQYEGWYIDDIALTERNKDIGVGMITHEELILRAGIDGNFPNKIIVAADITNFGNMSYVNVPITMNIFNSYNNSVFNSTIYVTRTASTTGEAQWNWETNLTGRYRIEVRSHLENDEVPINDLKLSSFVVVEYFHYDDFASGLTKWESPKGETCDPGCRSLDPSYDTRWTTEAGKFVGDNKHLRLKNTDGDNENYEEPNSFLGNGDYNRYWIDSKEFQLNGANWVTFGLDQRYDINPNQGIGGSQGPDTGTIYIKIEYGNDIIGTGWLPIESFQGERGMSPQGTRGEPPMYDNWGFFLPDYYLMVTNNYVDYPARTMQIRFELKAVQQSYGFRTLNGAGWFIDNLYVAGIMDQPHLTITTVSEETELIPGESKSFDVRVVNDGNIGTSIMVDGSGPEGWEVLFGKVNPFNPYNQPIEPGLSYPLFFNVTTPPNQVVGTYMTNIEAILFEGIDGMYSYTLEIPVTVLDHHDMVLTPDDYAIAVGPNDVARYRINVSNIGNGNDVLEGKPLVLKKVPSTGWGYNVINDSVSVQKYGDVRWMELEVRSPARTYEGDYSLVEFIVSSVEEPTLTRRIQLNTSVKEAHVLGLTTTDSPKLITQDSKEQSPQEVFTLYLSNYGNLPDTIELEVKNKPVGWEATLSATVVNLNAFWEDVQQKLTVTVPAGTEPGDYELSVYAVSSDPTVSVTLPLIARVREQNEIELTLIDAELIKSGNPGGRVLFNLSATNSMNFNTTVDITVDQKLYDWDYVLYHDNGIQLLSDTDGDGMVDLGELEYWGDSKDFILEVIVPDNAVGGSTATDIIVQAWPSQTQRPAEDFMDEQSLTVTVNVAPDLEMRSQGGVTTQIVNPNDSPAKGEFTLDISNTGNILERVELSWELASTIKQGFFVTFDRSVLEMAPFTSTQVNLTITVSEIGETTTPEPGRYTFIIYATTTGSGLAPIQETLPLYIEIEQVYKLTLNTGTPSTNTVEAGKSTSYDLNIVNTGNGNDRLELVMNGDHLEWVRLSQDAITLSKYDSEVVTMTITPASDAEPGTYYFTLETRSSDGTSVHSLVIPVEVEAPPSLFGLRMFELILLFIIIAVVVIIAAISIVAKKKPVQYDGRVPPRVIQQEIDQYKFNTEQNRRPPQGGFKL